MKKRCLLSVMLLSLVFLWGCGIELNSRMELNKDFSGHRIMTCTVSSSDLSRYFSGSKKDLDKVIRDACPKALVYKQTSDQNNTVYTFRLDYSSKKDYKKKVESMLNFAPEIKYSYSDSPFAKGVQYSENFSTKDLMSWLYTALYEKGYADHKSVDDLWNLKNTEFVFAGKKYETDDKISINEMSYVPVSSIDIKTSETADMKLKRIISIRLPKDTLEKHSSAVSSYFSGSSYQKKWKNEKDGKTLVISFTKDNFSDLCAVTRKVLHTSDTRGTYRVDTKNGSPFEFQLDFEETLDFKNFADESGKVPVTYTYTANDSFSDSGEQKIIDGKISKQKVNFSSSFAQPVRKYDITEVYKDKNDIRRSFSFVFSSLCNKRELAKLKESFMGSTISNVSLDKEDDHRLSFVQKGSVKQCDADLKKIWKGSSSSYESKNSLFQGQTSDYTSKFRLHLNNKKAKGTFTFASVSKDTSSEFTVASGSYKKIEMAQNIADKPVSALMESNESVASIHKCKLTGDEFTFNYKGNTATHHILNILKFLLPLGLLILSAILLYTKQSSVLYWLKKAKKTIQERFKKSK
ncbi:hypothetical protein [Anaerostipes sp.]|uniref:hypothetical protein n=1 Tax=Anaerostipes sp. TaxID=1872530 RepID=UPI0025C58945|nr:hypothetical protein [Anaerostipes sp.]MBS7009772.1 hypothetical protein [Anaerostipes sp.]